MHARERFLKTLQFDHQDKVLLEPGGGRESKAEKDTTQCVTINAIK